MQFIIDDIKYSVNTDLHIHTSFSSNHALSSIEDNVLAAREKGIKTLGISDHGPGHIFYGTKRKDIPLMREEIRILNEKYDDIDILLGVEANIINKNGMLDVRPDEFAEYDYVIAGYHYGVVGKNPIGSMLNHGNNMIRTKMIKTKMVRSKMAKTNMLRSKAIRPKSKYENLRLMKRNTTYIVRALENNDIKILTHPGDKAPVDLLEVAVVCAKTDTLVEINTWHDSLSAEDLDTMALTDCKFIIGSDAHSADRVGDFIGGVRLALKAGIDLNRIVNLKVG